MGYSFTYAPQRIYRVGSDPVRQRWKMLCTSQHPEVALTPALGKELVSNWGVSVALRTRWQCNTMVSFTLQLVSN